MTFVLIFIFIYIIFYIYWIWTNIEDTDIPRAQYRKIAIVKTIIAASIAIITIVSCLLSP